jgi:hypothetical protein
MDRDGELAVETFAHLLVERITIPGEEAHTIIRRAQEAERTERNAAHEYLKANNLLPTEEEWNEARACSVLNHLCDQAFCSS